MTIIGWAFMFVVFVLAFGLVHQDVDDVAFWYRWTRARHWDVVMAALCATAVFVYVGGWGDARGLADLVMGWLRR